MVNTLKTLKKPSVVSIFSGCGGLDYGFHLEGYETIWANDFAEWACKSFAANFGDVIHYKDITKIFGVFIDNAIEAAEESEKKEVEIDIRKDKK